MEYGGHIFLGVALVGQEGHCLAAIMGHHGEVIMGDLRDVVGVFACSDG
jgi:hypothetical protein